MQDLRKSELNVEERCCKMANSVYRVTEVIGVSHDSWEAAARVAVETAGKTLRDLRVAEVVRQDIAIENGALTYRIKLAISFKYEPEESGDPLPAGVASWSAGLGGF
jgi:flavin-binding protein dodecin